MHVTLCKWWKTTAQIFQNSRKPRDKYCHFYGDQSHNIEDCFALRKEIKELIKQAKFLVVIIDYFTKWVEAEPLATIIERNVKNFVWKGVICRFGIPRVLISDNGKQFDNGPFRELCGQLNIKNHYSSPRHPQANGQVEVTNRTLLK